MSKNTDLGNLVNGLFVSSTRNVGVGTTTPANALVVDKGNATASYLQFTAGTTTGVLATDGFEVGIDASGNGIISQQENLPLMVYTNSAERLRITAAGNVGIGTSSPSSFAGYNNLSLQASTSGYNLDFFNNSGVRRASIIYNNAVNFTFSAIESIPMNFETAGVERMRITSGGNVGIGTSSPISPLGNGLTIEGATYASLYFTNNGTQRGWFTAYSGGFIINTSSGTLALNNGGGNVLINTTTDNGNKLNVSGSIYSSSSISSAGGMYPSGGISTDNGIVINYGYAYGLNSNNQVAANGWYMQVSTSWSNNFRFFYGGTGVGQGSARAQIDTSGNYSALSDFNKKKDIAITSLGLSEVLRLKPCEFKFKDDEKQEDQLGFIAQEVRDVIPQAYYEDKEGGNKFIGLKYNAIIPVLVKAIQELKAEIETLKTNK
jgi:hypothetical protein